jgi:hypothetical protein
MGEFRRKRNWLIGPFGIAYFLAYTNKRDFMLIYKFLQIKIVFL